MVKVWHYFLGQGEQQAQDTIIAALARVWSPEFEVRSLVVGWAERRETQHLSLLFPTRHRAVHTPATAPRSVLAR